MWDLIVLLVGPLQVGFLCLIFVPLWSVEEASMHLVHHLTSEYNKNQELSMQETVQASQSFCNNNNNNNMAFSKHYFMALFN